MGRVHLIKSFEALLHEDVIIHTHQLMTRWALVAAAQVCEQLPYLVASSSLCFDFGRSLALFALGQFWPTGMWFESGHCDAVFSCLLSDDCSAHLDVKRPWTPIINKRKYHFHCQCQGCPVGSCANKYNGTIENSTHAAKLMPLLLLMAVLNNFNHAVP